AAAKDSPALAAEPAPAVALQAAPLAAVNVAPRPSARGARAAGSVSELVAWRGRMAQLAEQLPKEVLEFWTYCTTRRWILSNSALQPLSRLDKQKLPFAVEEAAQIRS
ncbi:unnamed protein product, partial [Effrenium voratum]